MEELLEKKILENENTLLKELLSSWKSKYLSLKAVHNNLKRSRSYHKFKKGDCLYIITDNWRDTNHFKIGITNDINTRLKNYRTSMPDCKLEFLVFTQDNKTIEKCLKLRYSAYLDNLNHEYISEVSLDHITNSIKELILFLNIEAEFETNFDDYNDEIPSKKQKLS